MAKSSRTEEPSELVKTTPPPAYLAKMAENDESLQGMAEKRVLGRLALVQGMSAPELKQQFGEGAAILKPSRVGIARAGESFLFVPLFFFVEWCTWSDINDKNSDRILARTFDPGSELARRSADKATRFEEYKQGSSTFKKRHVEHLNFAGFIYDGDAKGTPTILGFSRGEYGQGQGFITACTMRRVGPGKTAPLFTQVWKLTPAQHKSPQHTWWGFDYSAPDSGSLYVTEEESEMFRAEHLRLKEAHAKKVLIVDQSDSDDERQDESAAAEAQKKF